MKIQTAFVLLTALTSAAAMGCGSSSNGASTDAIGGAARASLHRAKGCGDLLSDLKADATYKLNKGVDRQIDAIQKCLLRPGGTEQSCAYYGGYIGGGGGFDAQATGAAEDSRAGAPTSGNGSAPPAAPSASSHSETNTQVKGVDEADFVKTDGANLYVIHGKAFKILKAWPANELKELSSLDIEGTPSEMFVDGGKVVIYSQVNGASLYTAAGITPKAQYQDYGYAYAGGGGAVDRASGAPSTSLPYPGPGGTPELYVPLTKITVLTHDGVNAQVAREMYFEGSYLDSRRVGTHVRTVLSGHAHGPQLKYSVYDLYPNEPGYPTTQPRETTADGTSAPEADPTTQTSPYPQTATAMIAALEQLRSANKAAIDASQLSAWMPYTFTKNAGAVAVSSVACEDFYVPTTGTTESGLTEIASIDLANPTAFPRETAILGQADTVYGSADTIYLAARAWVEPPFAWQDNEGDSVAVGSGSAGSGSTGSTETAPPPPSTSPGTPTPQGIRPQTTPATTAPVVTAWATGKTHIHKFEFATDPGFPNYVASGTVVGNVKDQFSLDDRDGYLRVATSESRMYLDQNGKYLQPTFPGQTTGALDRPQTVNHVFVLGASGGWLNLVGDVGELAPNEQIYSVRFVDGRGYVVTFRRVDPLFVLDLQNPTAPTKLAELKIPGFSEYMHPLDATHIMTIGRDATATGQARGLQLQIFDVTDGANPVLAHKFTYTGAEYGQSEAENDHKAFTYFADKKMLAFPYYAYSPSTSGSDGGMHSSLELFSVDLTSGFAKLGAIDHTSLVSQNPNGYCGGYYGPQVRRGVFLDNFVFSVSYGGVIAKDATNLGAAGAKLPLAAPQVNDGYGPSCAAQF